MLNLSKPLFLGNDLRKTYLNGAFLFILFAKYFSFLCVKENNNLHTII